MAMRVTEGMKFNNSLYNLYNLQSAGKTIMDQLSSQKKINRPSDDPTGIGKVLDIRNVQQMNEQYQMNIENADSWLKTSEARLSDLTNLLVNAQELAVAQATATATATTRKVAAANVTQLTEQMFSIANSQYMDRYIFGGTRTDQPPLSRDAFLGTATDLRMTMVSGKGNGFSGTASTAIRSLRVANVGAGDTLTVEGVTYTAIAGGAVPAAGQFIVGATDAETANNLRSAITAAAPGVYTLGGAGTPDITIELARKHQITAQGLAADTDLVGDAGGDLVIQVGGQGTITIGAAQIDPAATTLADLRDLINTDPENAGAKAVTAAIVDDGAGAGANRYRLVVTAVNGGPDYEISILANPTTLAFSSANTVELTGVSTNNRAHFSSYSGTTNKTYALKIVQGGSLADATYAISQDGGRTWGVEKTDLDAGVVELGDGVVMRFTPDTFTADDIFSSRASTPGYYDGDSAELFTDIGEGSPFAYGISGEAVFADRGTGQVDIFEVMKNLKTAMENNDQPGIQNQINKLRDAHQQVQFNITISGARMNRMEVARSYQADYEQRAADMLSKIEDADITKLATDLATMLLGLQASYKVASMMTQGTSILNFLK